MRSCSFSLLVLVIFANLCKFGHANHGENAEVRADIAAHWEEVIISDGLYPEKLSLFQQRGFFSIADGQTLQQLHRERKLGLDIPLPYPLRSSNGSFVKDQLLPLRTYLGALRINYADDNELSHIWNSLTDLHREKNCDSIVSFSNELKVLRLLQARMLELASEEGKSLLVASADGSTGTAEFLVHLIGIFAKIAHNMAESTKLSGYYPLIRAISQPAPGARETNTYVNPKITLRIYMNYFRQKVGDQLNRELDSAPYLPREPAVDTLHGMLYVYLQRSVLPYMNSRWVEEERLDSMDASVRGTVVVRNQSFHFFDHHDAANCRLLVVDNRDHVDLRSLSKQVESDKVVIDNDGDAIVPIAEQAKDMMMTEYNYLKIRVMRIKRFLYRYEHHLLLKQSIYCK